jgi:hypothetical protein
MIDGWPDVYNDYHEVMQACEARMCFSFLPHRGVPFSGEAEFSDLCA